MDPYRRVTRSTSNVRRNSNETEAAFWGRTIDPTEIERGQAEAIRAARRAASDDPSALLNDTQDELLNQVSQPAEVNQRSLMDEEVPNNLLEEEIPFTSNLTNYTEQSVRMVNSMRTAFVDNSPSTTERVTTPVDMDLQVWMDHWIQPLPDPRCRRIQIWMHNLRKAQGRLETPQTTCWTNTWMKITPMY